jgi:hypothetical protein
MTTKLTQERLKQVLNYEPESGNFTWKSARSSVLIGEIAGHTSKQTGYRLVGVDGSLFLAHRLAWLYVHGEFPSASIDHVDRNRLNNSIGNLRTATQSQNAFNSPARSTSKSGFKGVSWCHVTSKWRATATINGKQKSLGRHKELRNAVSAYNRFAQANHEAYACTDLNVTFYDLKTA